MIIKKLSDKKNLTAFVKASKTQKVYVSFVDIARYDSIAELRDIKYTIRWSSYWTSSPPFDTSGHNVDHVSQIRVKWDDKKSSVLDTFYPYELNWVVDHSGPTNWGYDRSAYKKSLPKVPGPKDILDQEIKVGDLLSYIVYKNRAINRVGKVVEIDDQGKVYCRPIKLRDSDTVTESENKLDKIYNSGENDTFVILTDDLLNKLMLAKLKS